MRASLWLLPLLLAVSLGPRLAFADARISADGEGALAGLDASLRAAGFSTHREHRRALDSVIARRPGCTLAASAETNVARLPALASIRPADWRQQLFLGGRELARFPRWKMTLHGHLQQQLARLKITYAYHPVVVLMAEPGCALHDVDFSGVTLRPL